MNPTWPETIDCGHGRESLENVENGRKTGIPPSKIAEGFWPPRAPGKTSVSGGPVRPRFHARPAYRPPADPRDAGIRGPARLEDRFAGKRNRLGRFPAGETGETAGGCAPPPDRRCAESIAICCCSFIQPATAISTNRNGSRTLGIWVAQYREPLRFSAMNRCEFKQIEFPDHTPSSHQAPHQRQARVSILRGSPANDPRL
jgi:hypothetical protein